MDYGVCILVFGLACAYITRALMLIERDSHEGPFASRTRLVKFVSGHVQKVALFDYVRRVFGVYEVKGDYWHVQERNLVEAFTCPYCLSFWSSLPFTGALLLWLYLSGHSVLVITVMAIPSHFAIAIVAQIAYKYLFEEKGE